MEGNDQMEHKAISGRITYLDETQASGCKLPYPLLPLVALSYKLIKRSSSVATLAPMSYPALVSSMKTRATGSR